MDLKTKRQSVERGVSVADVVDSIAKGQKNLNDIVVIGINDEDELVTAYSLGNRIEMVGILEALKSALIDEMNYPDS